MNPHMAGFFISGIDMTEHAVLFENADIVGSGDGWVAYLEDGKYSYVIYGESEDTAYIGEGDTVEEAKAQAEAMVNESK